MLCVIATSFTGCFGRKKSGEAFSMPIMDEPTSLDPQIADSNSEKLVAANCYEGLGFKSVPNSTEPRYDIIQAVELGNEERVCAFCEGIQAAAPVDSYVTPVPWDMPGYDSPVIMAAGAFVSGSSIELSADAPIREPYAVYFQGGLTYQHAKYGIIVSLQKMVEKNLIVW